MADLEKHDELDRESWIRWSVEFMRRGLWPDDIITVHGPHSKTGFWNNRGEEVSCEIDGTNDVVDVLFRSRKPHHTGKYDVRNVKFYDSNDGTVFPILKASELTPAARKWIKAAKRQLRHYHEERKKGRAAVETLRAE
jgi:hypothetical protein